MLIELWERLRGYDRWTETTARFERADVQKKVFTDSVGNRREVYSSSDTIAWTDQLGNIHRKSFKVSDNSSLYLMVDGEEVSVRYNPARPSRIYYRSLLMAQVRSVVTLILVILILAALFFLNHWSTKIMHGTATSLTIPAPPRAPAWQPGSGRYAPPPESPGAPRRAGCPRASPRAQTPCPSSSSSRPRPRPPQSTSTA